MLGPVRAGKQHRIDSFCITECAGDRGPQSKQAVFGDWQSLRATLLHLQGLQQEEHALSKALEALSAQLGAQFSSNTAASSDDPVDKAAPAPRPCSISPSGPLTVAELVPRLLRDESALKGVPASLVNEACLSTFPGGAHRVVEVEELQDRYADLLGETQRRVEIRRVDLQDQLARLGAEAGALEELIEMVWQKMAGTGEESVTRERFVEFVCAEGSEGEHVVEPEDVETFFSRMAKGEQVISYQQFREEITDGCLQILCSNIHLQLSDRKRYRDTWF